MAKSEFQYIEPSELPTYIHTMSGVTDETIAAKFISDAEHLLDELVGGAPRFYTEMTASVDTLMASGATVLPSSSFGSRRPNYWARGGVYVEVTNSTTASLIGQTRLVVASSGTDQVTLVSGFDVAVPAGTEFIYRQRSRFPRWQDRDVRGDPRMPDQLKRAVAYQVEYGIQHGSEEFGLGDSSVATDPDAGIQSRRYGSGYSESRHGGGASAGARQGMASFIAPKARVLMRRIIQSTGRLVA